MTAFFQGSTKCRARVITRIFEDGERVIHRSFIHNHDPKAVRQKARAFEVETHVSEDPILDDI